MTPSKILAASLVTFSLSAGLAQAQDATTPFTNPEEVTPFSNQAGLGDHIAARVLNMNGYNITNLGDPFFEGDAVTLGYFQRNIGWGHIAKQDIDMSGFSLGNVGEIVLDEGKVLGGVFESPAISQPEITGGIMSGMSLKNSSIEVPMVTGGTFKSPALIGPTLDRASLTGGDIGNAVITGGTVTGTEILDSQFIAGLLEDAILSGSTRIEGALDISDAKIIGSLSGKLDMGDNRITEVADATEDSDAMNLASTREMIDGEVEKLSAVLEEMRAAIDGDVSVAVVIPEGDTPVAASEIDTVPTPMDIAEVSRKLRSVSGDFMVSGSLSVSGSLEGVTSQFRPTPGADKTLGRLTGADAMDILRKFESVVYNLPEGGLAVGIDPGTIPPQLEFMKRPAENDEDFESVDYVQMIGPMLAAIQHLDGRIEELERRLTTDR